MRETSDRHAVSGRARRAPSIATAGVIAACVASALAGCATAPTSASPTATEASPSPTAPTPSQTDVVVPDPQPTANTGSVTVTIVSYGADGTSVYASGLVTGDAPDGGICTLTATSADGVVLSGHVDAETTPAAVNCGLVEIAASPGRWTLVLTYAAEGLSASSDPTNVERR